MRDKSLLLSTEDLLTFHVPNPNYVLMNPTDSLNGGDISKTWSWSQQEGTVVVSMTASTKLSDGHFLQQRGNNTMGGNRTFPTPISFLETMRV